MTPSDPPAPAATPAPAAAPPPPAATAPAASAPAWLAVLCVAAALLGVGLRFTALDQRTRSWDESATGLRIAAQRNDVVRQRMVVEAPGTATAGDLVAACAIGPEAGPADVVRSIARNEPHHGPLFFVVAHLWGRAFGVTTESLRALAALLSTLGLPAFYLLGRDALGSRRAGLVALALAALSPLLVALSQDARPHGLGLTLFAWATWALVRGLGAGAGRGPWIAHALLLGAAVNAYPATALGAPAHLALALAWAPRGERRGALLRLLASGAGAAALALPWAINVALASGKATKMLGWTLEPMSASRVLSALARTLRHTLVDVPAADADGWDALGAAVAAALAVAGIARLRSARPGAAALGAGLAAVLLGAALLDLARGTHVSTTPRHLLPAVLGLLLLSAAAIDAALGSARGAWRALGAGALAALLAAGGASGVAFVRSRHWWTEAGGTLATRIDLAVGSERAAVIVGRDADAVAGSILAASFSMPPSTLLLDLERTAVYDLPPLTVDRIALIGPSPSLSIALQSAGYKSLAAKAVGHDVSVEVLDRRSAKKAPRVDLEGR